MLVGQEIEEGGDEEEHVEDVTAGDAAQGDDTAAHREVPTVSQKPSIPSPTPPTPPPQPHQDLPSTSQVQHTPPQSPQAQPQPQPQPQQATDFPMSLLQEALDACAALTRRVKHLEYDKMAQALEITKLKRRVKKLEKGNKGRIIDEMDKDDAVVLMDDKVEDKKDEKAKVVTASNETVTAFSTIISTAEPQVSPATITVTPTRVAAAPSRRRKGVLKAKEDPAVQRYQVMKRKPQTEGQARKNMMMYLKNVDGFKLDYFKGISYNDVRPIFEAKFNSNIEFLLKTKEQMEEEENKAPQSINETPAQKAANMRKLNEEVKDLKRHMKIVPDKDDDVYTKATPLVRKVLVVDYKIIELNNKPYYKIIRADGTPQLIISFLTLLKNYDREDLEAL
nr:hypothetical protein [Tanacetum cinerariifolium]